MSHICDRSGISAPIADQCCIGAYIPAGSLMRRVGVDNDETVLIRICAIWCVIKIRLSYVMGLVSS